MVMDVARDTAAAARKKTREMWIQVPERVFSSLADEAARLGVTPNILARMRLAELHSGGDEDRREVRIPLGNYREIAGYVEEKKLGSVNTFAAFAMQQYMTRYPPRAPAKSAKGKGRGEAPDDARAVQPEALEGN